MSLKLPGPEYLHTAREAWLQAAIRELAGWFTESVTEIPENLRVTVGFGPTGAKQESNAIMGGTLHTRCSTDGAIEIFISPEAADPADMLGTLVHELVHAVLLRAGDRAWWGHQGSFSALATDVGLQGPMMSSTPGPELLEELERILGGRLGAFPGAQVVVSGTGPAQERPERTGTGPKPQTGSRYRLAQCQYDKDDDCYGYQVRMTLKWATWGMPQCPYGHEMVLTDQ